ncbi:MAG: hypothetical protein ABI980_07610 [Nitrospirota bacterium]
MSLSWAQQHFQQAKDLMPVDSPSWHLAEGLKQLTESLDQRLRNLERHMRPKS